MHKIYVALVIAAVAAIATPVNAASDDTHAKNVAFLSDLIGNYDTATPVEFVDGTVMTLGEAIDRTAAKAGSVDLGALASGAAANNLGAPGAGDVWVFEVGTGDCTANVMAPQSVFLPVHGQLWIYNGGVGDLSTDNGIYTQIIDWTTKGTMGGFYGNTAGFTVSGVQDFYCYSFFGLHVAFPFADGVATLN